MWVYIEKATIVYRLKALACLHFFHIGPTLATAEKPKSDDPEFTEF